MIAKVKQMRFIGPSALAMDYIIYETYKVLCRGIENYIDIENINKFLI